MLAIRRLTDFLCIADKLLVGRLPFGDIGRRSTIHQLPCCTEHRHLEDIHIADRCDAGMGKF